jgi:hypothetical protein
MVKYSKLIGIERDQQLQQRTLTFRSAIFTSMADGRHDIAATTCARFECTVRSFRHNFLAPDCNARRFACVYQQPPYKQVLGGAREEQNVNGIQQTVRPKCFEGNAMCAVNAS